MNIRQLILKNFRNHSEKSLEFKKNITVIIGPNGIGKSNILEAINLISTTKSQKAKYDIEVIKQGEQTAYIKICADIANEQDTLEMAITAHFPTSNISKKVVKLNKTPKTLKSFSGHFNTVLFTPEDMTLLTGSPQLRRRYIDNIFFQTDTSYKNAYAYYAKAVKQRNKLLSEINETHQGYDVLEMWTEQASKHGEVLSQKRFNLLQRMNEQIGTVVSSLSNTETLASYEICYKQSPLQKLTAENLHKEIAAKTTLYGPHRDDFNIRANDADLGVYGSRGQQRTAILALKICELNYIKEVTAESPVLLLDDIFSELDKSHQSAIEHISHKQQTIITSATEDIPTFTDAEIIFL